MTREKKKLKHWAKQTCQSLLPIGQGHARTHTHTHKDKDTQNAWNKSVRICTHPFTGVRTVDILPVACGRVIDLLEQEQGVSVRTQRIICLYTSKKFQLNSTVSIQIIAQSSLWCCFSTILYSRSSWWFVVVKVCRVGRASCYSMHWTTNFNETGLLAHYSSPLTCKLIRKRPYWFLIA